MTGLGRRIAIVEDDPGLRESLIFLLEAMGYAALGFAAPSRFNEAFQHGLEADCLILDVNLPEQDGFAFHAWLVGNGRAAPAIFMTADVTAACARRAEEAGAVALLAKPFSDEAMAAALAKALG